jgi:spore maturation protein SpmB
LLGVPVIIGPVLDFVGFPPECIAMADAQGISRTGAGEILARTISSISVVLGST